MQRYFPEPVAISYMSSGSISLQLVCYYYTVYDGESFNSAHSSPQQQPHPLQMLRIGAPSIHVKIPELLHLRQYDIIQFLNVNVTYILKKVTKLVYGSQ